MPAFQFDLPLLQAISDWQKSSTPRRAKALKEASASLPRKYRTCGRQCYRQVGLTKGFVWELIAEDFLREKISSWTVDYTVATAFKGGVPHEDGEYKGVIFAMHKPGDRVIVNLDRLYNDPAFVLALARNKDSISGYADGAGRHGNEQREVVMEVESVTRESLCSLGGYSSKFEDLVEILHLNFWIRLGRSATPSEISHLREVIGPAWIDREATKRVLARLEPRVDMLKELKRLRDEELAKAQATAHSAGRVRARAC